jgi:tetratricopeptide (TPR) repeat protein
VTAIDLEPIFEQVQVGDPVGAAYRLVQQLGSEASGRAFYDAGSRALARRDDLGEGALRFARICFGEAVERDPDMAEAHHDLASTMRELGMAADAIPHYRRSLELSPGDIDSEIGLGAAQCDSGQLDEGIATLRRAADEHPDNGHAFANLGVALEGAGRDEEAASAYAKAVARFDAALLEADDDEAAAEAALRLRWARIQHAQLLERLERWPQAVVEFRHLYEEERALAEAEAEAEAAADDSDEDGGDDQEEPAGGRPGRQILDDGAEVDGHTPSPELAELQAANDEIEGEGDGDGEGEIDELDATENAGRLGLERLFARLVQLGRHDLAYLVLDDLGGELADDRTRATYAIYDAGDGLPQIMVEDWDGGARKKIDPGGSR